jgi:nucleolin
MQSPPLTFLSPPLLSFHFIAGEISSARVPIFEDSGRPKGVAFVDFTTVEGQNAALAMDGEEMMGRWLAITVAEQRAPRSREVSEKPAGCLTVFVGNLAWGVTDDHLYELFKDCGTIGTLSFHFLLLVYLSFCCFVLPHCVRWQPRFGRH